MFALRTGDMSWVRFVVLGESLHPIDELEKSTLGRTSMRGE